MRALISVIILGLFGAGLYYLSIATHGSTPAAAARNGLIAGLVSWGLGTVLTVFAMFTLRDRR